MLKKTVQLLFVVVILLMIVASLVDKAYGGTITVYGTWWYTLVWCLLTVVSVCYIFRHRLYKRPATFMLHISFVVILLGALTTHIFSEQGALDLRLGKVVNSFITKDGKCVDLPFSLQLKQFHIINYAGTDSPMNYHSEVSVIKNDEERTNMNISMNNIGEIDGYRFYQASYDSDMRGSVLSVCHDPWGIGITYTGYALFLLSMILMLITKKEGMRVALRNYRKAMTAIILLFTCCVCTVSAEPKTFDEETAEQFGNLYVYYNGRICPMSTLAHDLTLKLHGSTTYKGFNENQILSGWIFFPTSWIDEPYIKIKSEAKDALGASSKYVSYMQFIGPEGYRLESVMDDIHQGKPIDGKSAIIDADEKVNILRMVFSGELMKTFPCKDRKGNLHWVSSGDRLPKNLNYGQWIFIRKGFDYCTELAVTHQDDDLHRLLDKIKEYQIKTATNVIPDNSHFKAEVLYNKLGYTLYAALLLVIVAVLGITCRSAALIRQEKKGHAALRLKRIPTVLSCIAAVLVMTYIITVMSLRGYISGYLPMANGYETMQFMALISLVFAILPRSIFRREYALLVSAMALFVSLMDESNPQLTQLMPVLHSPLLSIHVCIIMIAYSLLAIEMLISLEAIISGILRKDSSLPQQLELQSRIILYPAMACLGIGIFIGAIWANVSWGTYWSWDPKETWALITFMIYAVPLHTTSLPIMRKPRAYHIYILCAFLSVIITYFGVNYFMSGMHSYA